MLARRLTRLARPSPGAINTCRPFHATPARFGLLKGMDPILTADLLHVLRSAGHGDEITLVDCNFPAASTATKTVTGAPIVLAGCDLPTAVDAICSIMPLDFFVDCPALYMAPEPGNELPPAGEEVHDGIRAALKKHAPDVTAEPLDRYAFYDRADTAFAIVQCVGERRPYGNVVLKKGVVGPDGKDLMP